MFPASNARILVASLSLVSLATLLLLSPFFFGAEAKSDMKKRPGLFQRTESVEADLPNYDIRNDSGEAVADRLLLFRSSIGLDASAVAAIRDGFVRGEADLKARRPDVTVEYNTDIRVPEVVSPGVWGPDPEFLTYSSRKPRPDILREFARQNSLLFGIDDQQIDALTVAADYTNPSGNMSFTHLEQTIGGVPVFRGEIKAGFTSDGRIVRVINNLAPGLGKHELSRDFGDPEAAVKAAGENIRQEFPETSLRVNKSGSTESKIVFGEGDWATTAERMYFPTEPGVAVPAWRVLIWKRVNAYYVIVDAARQTVLWRKNITNDQAQSATYNVYTANNMLSSADSPAPLSPGPIDPTLGTQAPVVARSNVTLIGNEGALSFNNNGWITDGSNVTDGNANEAGIDRNGVDGVDAAQVGSPNRVFDTAAPAWNPPPGSPGPGDAPLTAQAQRGAVIQMFYVMNRYHDELYKLGFTEPARNFQQDNFGRGGSALDRIRSEGQDSSGTDNANFSTPSDGGRGRMQMYLWSGPTPDYDGTADADIIVHEVTHGTSNRLVGNASGILTNMAGGLGEGWGDFYAHTLLSEPTDPINGVYSMGGYATYLAAVGYTSNYYHGIRKFPKAVLSFTGGPLNRPHNPLTFADADSLDFNIGDGAYPRGPFGISTVDQVHNLGEIWSTALWEVRCLMVARLGHAAGSQRALQVVTDGMKLSPLNPTFLQARDAIIAAALALPIAPEAAADAADVREGFRIRGMGFFATIENTGTGANNTRVTEDFHLQNVYMIDPFAVDDSVGDNDGYPEPGEWVQLSVTITNVTGATVNNVSAIIPGYVPVSYGNLLNGQSAAQVLDYFIPEGAACGAAHNVTINVNSDLGAQAPEVRSFVLGVPVVLGSPQNFDGVVAPALPAGWSQTNSGGQSPWVTSTTTPDTVPNAAFGNNGASIGESSLISPAVAIPAGGATVTFRRRNAFETPDWDGMVLEISINGGAYQDIVTAGGSFTAGGYNGAIATGGGNPLAGRSGWIGTTSGLYVTTTALLPAAANGQSINLRWRIGADVTIAAEGARIDGVSFGAFDCLVPTASNVSVSGRVFTADGRGISNAGVSMVDEQGLTRSTRTNSFGYYRLDNVSSGATYVFNVSARGHGFAPRTVVVTDDVASLDFYSTAP